MIGHFIITLFNLRLSWRGTEKALSEIDTATDIAYLEKSFRNFEQYTVPSVKNQSCKRFKWIVLFSKDTPAAFVEKIIGGGYCEQFQPLFLTDEEGRNFRDYLVDYIRNNYPFDTWITTRLDNDDAVPLDFVEEIQNCAVNKKGDYAISFPDGYQYDVSKKVLAHYHFPNNHFTTYVTSRRDKTIYDFGHINLTSQNEVLYIKQGCPMWIEVIHGMNVYNRMGTLNPLNYVRKDDLRERFGVDVVVSQSLTQLVWWYLYFAVRKGWNKRHRIGIFLRRKLHIRYKDDRTDR